METGYNDNGNIVCVYKPYIYKEITNFSKFYIVKKFNTDEIESKVIYKEKVRTRQKHLLI